MNNKRNVKVIFPLLLLGFIIAIGQLPLNKVANTVQNDINENSSITKNNTALLLDKSITTNKSETKTSDKIKMVLPNETSDIKTEKIEKKDNNAIALDESIATTNKNMPESFDTSNIEVPKEILDVIMKSDNKKAEKDKDNYKNVMAEFNVPNKFKNEIDRLIKDGHAISDIFIAYNFLYENYGELKELSMIVSEKEQGKQWGEIFFNYNNEHEEFKPSNFEKGQIEVLMEKVSADDIMIADRISQKGISKFDELIQMRKDNKDWKYIKTDLGIVNLEDKFPHIGISSVEVKKYAEKNKLSDEQVIGALILARKNNLSDDEIINKVKQGKSKEEINTDYYTEKYN